MTLSVAAGFVLYAMVGAIAGVIFFALLILALRRLGGEVRPVHLVMLFAVRFAGIAALFWLIAQQGAVALIAALAGFLLARFAVQRSLRLGA